MRNLKYVLIFGLVLMIFAGCSKEEIQPDPLNTADEISLKGAKVKKGPDHFVPFRASFNVSVDLESVVIIPPKYQFAYAYGNATHLGKTEVILEQWWWPTSDTNVFPWYGGGKGFITFTAANGDILEAFYQGAVATHNATLPVLVSLTATITGGTGRFEDAEGSFEWDVEYYPEPQNTGTVILSGTIKY